MTEIEAIENGFEKLARVLSIPKGKMLWNAEAVAEYFGLSTSATYRTILCKPDFPEAIKIERGCKRWVSGEVIEWAERQRERRGRKQQI